jgi:hypothetical protein
MREDVMTEVTLARVEALVSELTPEEQLTLLERLIQQLRQSLQKRRQPQDLYGIWRSRFPADFDLDAALSEIRHEWERERPEATH